MMARVAQRPPILIGLNAVIVAVTEDQPRVLTVQRAEHALAEPRARRRPEGPRPARPALPFGPLDPEADATLELGLRGWVRRQTALELGYVEQLYTFADRHRDPRQKAGPRIVSVAYLALVREGRVAGGGEARWRDVYELLPWEDSRAAPPALVRRVIQPALLEWCEAPRQRLSRARRRDRADICFGLHGSRWDAERVLERYELLFEAGLVAEAGRDGRERALGPRMALDHRRILATALGRLRGKLKYRPVVFELLPATFTLLQLQRTVEALAGLRLHKQNFRRLVESQGLVEGTGVRSALSAGRPAELFRFRREVLRERRAPGVGLPAERARG